MTKIMGLGEIYHFDEDNVFGFIQIFEFGKVVCVSLVCKINTVIIYCLV